MIYLKLFATHGKRPSVRARYPLAVAQKNRFGTALCDDCSELGWVGITE